MEMDRRTLTGIFLILFLFASWSLGVVMDLSPAIVEIETEATFDWFGQWPMLVVSFLIIASIALLIRGRTPAFIIAVFFLPASMVGAYAILLIGFSWSLLFIVLIIFLSAIAIWKGFKDESMSAYLVGVALIGVLLLATFFLGAGEMITEEVQGNGEGPSIPWGDPGGFIETTFGGFGTFMLIILVGAIITFLIAQRAIPLLKSSTENKEDEKGLEDQLSSTVDSAVTELREGKDVHSTIIRCYQQMCLILEKKGAKNFEFMTPREFEKQAIRTLDVSPSKISEIRKVFELAKYSSYRLGEEERKRAVNALKELRKELG